MSICHRNGVSRNAFLTSVKAMLYCQSSSKILNLYWMNTVYMYWMNNVIVLNEEYILTKQIMYLYWINI